MLVVNALVGFWICIYVITPWIESNPHKSLNPTITQDKSSPCGHQIQFLKTSLTTKEKLWSTMFTKDFPMVKMSLHWK